MTQHAEYRNSVIDRLRSLGSNLVTATRLWALQDLAILAWTANLDTVGFILRRGYSGIGRPPRDPAAMFRAWVLATSLGISSPTKWAHRLSTDPVLAILCGFEPTDTPGATTFVDFTARLTRTMRAHARVHCPHRKRGKGSALPTSVWGGPEDDGYWHWGEIQRGPGQDRRDRVR